MIGSIVGNYKITRKLGEGGMGAVYQGVDMMLEREVAIKALRPELASQPQVVERFRSEAVTLAKLNHPNIATLYSFFRQSDDFFMVLEFVRGETLDGIISSRGAMGCERAIPLFCQVLDGIDHAHRYGIIHRDIKPANIMLTDEGALKVLDFGIARILGTARMTRQGHLIGTIEYMSPEQVKGLETDARSDIYSLGMLLYEMLTGRPPFQIENEFELMKAQIEQMPVAPRQLNPEIPEAVEAAIFKAIAKNPDERFQSAGEFRATLINAGYAGALKSGERLAPNFSGMTMPLNSQSRPGTQPINWSPTAPPPTPSAPPAPSPYATIPSMPSGNLAGENPNLAATLVTPSVGGAAASGAATPNGSHSLKETRVGSIADIATPAVSKPTQIAPPAAPPANAEAKKSNVKLFVGVGTAAVLLFGLMLIAFIAFALTRSSGTKTPSVATQPTAAPSLAPTPAPTVETAVAPSSTTVNSGATIPSETGASKPVSGDVIPLQPVESRASSASAKPRPAAPPSASRPAQTQPRKPAANDHKRQVDELMRMN